MVDDLREILGTKFDCDCGRRHRVPVRKFLYQTGAMEKLPEIIQTCASQPVNRPLLVADQRTWLAAGWATARILDDCDSIIVEDRAGQTPVCDQRQYRKLKAQLEESTVDMLIAVGSGVINDLCKWVSFDLGIPYIVLATAASMNGYSSANVAPTVNGVKALIEARPPLAVLTEPSLIVNAPPEMATAGFGDTIAKFFSHADWLVNHTLFDEYYCPFCASMVARFEHLFLENPAAIAAGDPAAMGGLFEALFWAGIGMTLIGSSAPASGGEHLLSHTLDMVADAKDWPHDLHGRQVGLGSIFAAALYEKLLQIDEPKLVSPPVEIDAPWWSSDTIAAAVAAQLAAKQPAYETAAARLQQPGVWDNIRQTLRPILKSPQQIRRWLEQVKGATRAADIGRTPDQIKQALLHAHEMRKRFTVIDLAWLLGIMPAAAEEITDQWLT